MLDLSGISRAPLVAARVGFAGLLFAIFLALALGQRVAVVSAKPNFKLFANPKSVA